MSRLYKTKNTTNNRNSGTSLRQTIKSIIQEINGFLPYEKNISNFLKIGKEKKALKFAKKRLGNMRRAKNKVEIVNNLTRFN